MPISNEEWNSGRTGDTLEGQILAFLKRNLECHYRSNINNSFSCCPASTFSLDLGQTERRNS